MNKIVEDFGTIYLASHYAGEVLNYLSNHDEVDLAGARICADVMRHLNTAAYNGKNIRDTADPERDWYMQENRRRGEMQRSSPQTVTLPTPTAATGVYDLIMSLRTDLIYTPRDSRIEAISTAILSQAARPELQLDLKSQVSDVFKLIHRNLFPSKHRWEEFYVLQNGTTFVIKKPKPEEYNQFVSDNIVVPTEFGNTCLFKLREWDTCLDRIAKLLEKSLRPRNKKIKDYL